MREKPEEDIRSFEELMNNENWVKEITSRLRQDPLKIDIEETEELIKKMRFDISK